MTAFLLLALAQVIPFDLRIETPWTLCQPVLLATLNDRPIPPTLTLYRDPLPMRVRSSCRVAVRWACRCDVGLAVTWPEGGVVGEAGYAVELTSMIRLPSSVQLTCRIAWTPCQQSDLDADCKVDWEDLVMLDVTRAVNRLEIFAWMQREWASLPIADDLGGMPP